MIFSNINMSDLLELSEVHIKCWHETYRGVISDAYLNSLTVNMRAGMWSKVLEDANHYGELVRCGGKLVAFISAGKIRDDFSYSKNEIFALYVLKEFQQRGLGQQLCKRFFDHSRVRDACVWVLEDNSACRFYEKIGGEIVDRRDIEIGGDRLKEILYKIVE